MQIKTAGELRGFLADVMIDIRNGAIEPSQAQAISKIAAQINQSLSVEVNTALQLERMGKDHPVAGSMLIGERPAGTTALPPRTAPVPAQSADGSEAGFIWCDQCDMMVPPAAVAGCKSKYCTAKAPA